MPITKFCVFALLISVTMLTGCSTTDHFTAISSKNVNLSNIKIDHSKTKGRQSGEDCKYIIVFIPTGVPSLKDALDRALEPSGSNILLDAVVEHNFFYIPYIYGQDCWNVKGDAYDTYQ